jgi:hypothetical protein
MRTDMLVRDTFLLALVAAPLSCDDGPGDALEDPCEGVESGQACTWLGLRGEVGFNGDGLHRLQTRVNEPQDLVFLPDGTAWFTDFNNFLIRRSTPTTPSRRWSDP